MRRNRRAKIVATVGPASASPEMLEALFLAGVDMFRLNFSHGTHDDHAKVHRRHPRAGAEGRAARSASCRICRDRRSASARSRTARSPLQPASVALRARPEPTATATSIPLPHPEIFAAVVARRRSADRRRHACASRVTGVGDDFIEAKVVIGGGISNRKGVNLPDTVLEPVAADRKGPRRSGVRRWSSASIGSRCRSCSARRTSIEARGLIGDRAGIMAKIEKPAALEQIDDIVRALRCGDGRARRSRRGNAARGGARPQKELIRACRLVGKPVIVATQMLEFDGQRRRPRRAPKPPTSPPRSTTAPTR